MSHREIVLGISLRTSATGAPDRRVRGPRLHFLWRMLCAGFLQSCAASPSPSDGSALYAQVDDIITKSCARETCHGGLVANAHMDLMAKGPHAALVNVPSCEYDRMKRVEPGSPQKSWIMIKLAGPVRFRQYASFIDFQPDPSWQPGAPECSGHFDDGAPWFGTRMPPQDTTMITDSQVAIIRSWIEAGAKGPDG